MQRDVPVDVDPLAEAAPRARPLAAARGLPRVRAARPAAPPGGGARRRRRAPRPRPSPRRRSRARVRERHARRRRRRSAGGDGGRARRRARREPPEGELFADDDAVALRASRRGDEVLVGDVRRARRSSSPRSATGPSSPTTPRRCGAVPPNLAHDTLLGAYLLEPARRGFPFRELVRGARPGRRRRRTRPAPTPCSSRALAAWQREQIARARPGARCMDEIELPLVRVLRDDGGRGRAARTSSAWPRSARRVRDEVARARARDLGRWPARSSSIGSPQQLGEVLFEKLGLSRKRRGKTGFSTDARVLQAIRDEHEIIPKIERWRELNQLVKTYLDVAAAARRRREPHPHDVRAGGRHDRPARPRRTPTCRTSRSAPSSGREIRGCFEAAPGNVLISRRLLAGRAARARPHRRRAGAQGDLRARRGRPHRDGARRSSARTPAELDADGPLEVEDDQLRDRLRPQRLRPRRPPEHPARGGQGVHRRLPRALPARGARSCRTTIEQAAEQGYVTTLFGRRRQIPELRARNWQVRTLGERLAVNTVIQGTAADVMKLAMIRAPPRAGRRAAWRRG